MSSVFDPDGTASISAQMDQRNFLALMEPHHSQHKTLSFLARRENCQFWHRWNITVLMQTLIQDQDPDLKKLCRWSNVSNLKKKKRWKTEVLKVLLPPPPDSVILSLYLSDQADTRFRHWCQCQCWVRDPASHQTPSTHSVGGWKREKQNGQAEGKKWNIQKTPRHYFTQIESLLHQCVVFFIFISHEYLLHTQPVCRMFLTLIFSPKKGPCFILDALRAS